MLRRSLIVLLGLVLSVVPQVGWSQEAAAPNDSLLSREPETPDETFQAVMTMLKLARPDLARRYLDVFMASSPDDATLLKLRDRFGTATFVQLSRTEALQPVGGELLDRLNLAAQNQLQDPAFQQSLIDQLTGNLRERESAIALLQALDEQAAPLIIQHLNKSPRLAEEADLVNALLRLGPATIGPLTAALMSPNQNLRAVAADLLGRLAAKQAVLPLSAVAFDPAATPTLHKAARTALARIEFGSADRANQVTGFRLAERLGAEARQHLQGMARWDVDPEGQVPLWGWSDAAGTVVLQKLPPELASLQQGEQYARQALALNPENPDSQALLLAFIIQRDVVSAGWENPIPTGPGSAFDLAVSMGPDLIQRTLRLGAQTGSAAAQIVALQALALTAGRGEALSAGSPLLEALRSPEPRVQFAAAETILQLDPSQPFPGASQVVAILIRALNESPQRKSVIVDPNGNRGAALAGLISSLGFDSSLAATGKEGFERAATEGNIELAVLHLNTVRWELSQTVANLRADPRTARIPIAVYGPTNLRHETYRKLGDYPLISYLDDAGDPGILKDQLEPLLHARPVPELTEGQRQQQIISAAFWLRHIASGRRTDVFPLDAAEEALGSALDSPQIAADALIALGSIGKPSVQQRLADAGLAIGLDEPTRLAAIAQLGFHIQRFGRMLDNATVERIAAELKNPASPDLKSGWSAVAGALRPDLRADARELLRFPPPQIPAP